MQSLVSARLSDLKSQTGSSDGSLVLELSKFIAFKPLPGESVNVPAACPFHKGGTEVKPSFYLYVGPGERYGSSFCHTCGEGWSLKGLLRKLGVTDIDGIAERTGAVNKTRSREEIERQAIRGLDFGNPVLPEYILGLFDYCPVKLLESGFTKDTLRAFQIGFDAEELRITYPIRDHLGNLIGMSGRTVVGAPEKYRIYKSRFAQLLSGYNVDKSHTLWGIDKLYLPAMAGGGTGEPLVLCEGFKAAMWVYQAGHRNVVAAMGTALSREQIVLVQRTCNRVILFLDNDLPGYRGTLKLLDKQGQNLPNVRVANYGPENEGKSPDDLAPDVVLRALSTAMHPLEWRRQNEHREQDNIVR